MHQGAAFHSEWGGGRTAVTVRVQPGAVSFSCDQGTVDFPLTGLELEWGGADGSILFLRNGAFPGTVLTVQDPAFLNVLKTQTGGMLRPQMETLQRSKRKRYAVGMGWIGAILLALFALYVGVGALAEGAVELIPFSTDEAIGEFADKQMTASMGAEVRTAIVVDAVEQMVDRLAPHASIDGVTFRIKVIESDQVNAFALPGGYMVVFTGLLRRAESPEEVAAVLGHEMAHVTGRHGMRRIARSIGVLVTVQLILGDIAGASVALQELFTLAAVNGYSRDQETAADVEGVRMLHAAGIPPEGAIRFFEHMKEDQTTIEEVEVLSWLSTHPDHTTRIESLQKTIAELGPLKEKPLDLDWEAIQVALGDGEKHEKASGEPEAESKKEGE